jgi:hypothetical protein
MYPWDAVLSNFVAPRFYSDWAIGHLSDNPTYQALAPVQGWITVFFSHILYFGGAHSRPKHANAQWRI